ncbi:helix-turn-helix domain-containing protein, partial [Oscillospiraceae bacterium 38-13]
MEEYLPGQGSSMAIAEKYKLHSGNLVLDWIKEYYRHRNSVEEAGGVSMAKRKHTRDERVQAVREHPENGKSYSELSERYGTTAQVIQNWVKRYQEIGVAGLEDRRGKRLASQTSQTPEEALRIKNACLERE